MTPSLGSIEGLIVRRKLYRTARPDRKAEQLWLNDAKTHLESAAKLVSSDPRLAVAAAHDAIRKAITAHMDASCLRTQGDNGAHAVVVEYARYALGDHIDQTTLDKADGLRSLRHEAEYSDLAGRIDARTAKAATAVAELVVEGVRAAMADRQPSTR